MSIFHKWPQILRNCLCCNYTVYMCFPFTVILAILQLKCEESWNVFDNFTSLEGELGTEWTDACTKSLILFIPIREQHVHSTGRRRSLYLLTDWFFVPYRNHSDNIRVYISSHYHVIFILSFFPHNCSIIDSFPALY